MVKSVIKDSCEVKGDEYPIIKATSSGLVVLFITEKTGVVIKTSDLSTYLIGAFSDDWAEEECFKPFTGTIELSNR